MKITNVEGIRKDDLIAFLNQIEGNPLIKIEEYDYMIGHTDEEVIEVEHDELYNYILLTSRK